MRAKWICLLVLPWDAILHLKHCDTFPSDCSMCDQVKERWTRDTEIICQFQYVEINISQNSISQLYKLSEPLIKIL